MKRSALASLAVVLLALLAIGVANSQVQAQTQDGVTVTIDNFSFMAPTLTIPAGTKVTWINHDDVPHTVVSSDQKFKSKALDTDESYSFTFNDPGNYPYFCSIHPKMVANIVVTEKKAMAAK